VIAVIGLAFQRSRSVLCGVPFREYILLYVVVRCFWIRSRSDLGTMVGRLRFHRDLRLRRACETTN
jgi:hypothetical protein